MLGRIINLLKAKANKGMSQLETPEVLAEQALQELESNIKNVKEAVVASITTEKSLEQQLKKASEEIATWEKRAAMAVQQNNDQVARECLQKKQEINESLTSSTSQLQSQKKCTADLKARYAQLDEQLRGFNQKKANLMARGQASDAVSKANDLMSSSSATGAGKWEQKIQEKEFKAAATREMGSEPVGNKFAELDNKIQVDDELAALKAQMAPAKLIVDVDPTPAKTVADPDVPMVVEKKEKDDKDGGK